MVSIASEPQNASVVNSQPETDSPMSVASKRHDHHAAGGVVAEVARFPAGRYIPKVAGDDKGWSHELAEAGIVRADQPPDEAQRDQSGCRISGPDMERFPLVAR